MNKPYTINELYKMCKNEINKGNGNKIIMISGDDEGNSLHYLWYSFEEAEHLDENLKIAGDSVENYGLDTRIADIKDTIILG